MAVSVVVTNKYRDPDYFKGSVRWSRGGGSGGSSAITYLPYRVTFTTADLIDEGEGLGVYYPCAHNKGTEIVDAVVYNNLGQKMVAIDIQKDLTTATTRLNILRAYVNQLTIEGTWEMIVWWHPQL
jgi:hypothetical protein